MDESIDGLISAKGNSCRLQLTHTGENFTGSYGDCMPKTMLDGIIYDEKLISAIQYTEKNGKNQNYCVYSGKLAPDGSIRGTYYTDGGESGDFQWINAANYLGEIADAAPKSTGTEPKPVYIAPSGTRPTSYNHTTPPKSTTPAAADATEDTPAPTPDTRYHVVEEDDSMYRLALKYGLKLKKILWLNHRKDATDDKLNLGDRIRVSE
jgi:LysM repeat protein